MFWNQEVADRKRKLGIRGTKGEEVSFEHRFLCPDCVASVLGAAVETVQAEQ